MGDSVISTCPLVAPPVEPPGVRLEIPSASRGTIVDVRPYDYPYPYAVVFEVGEGGVVEVDVTHNQLARVTSHGPIASVRPMQEVPSPEPWALDQYITRNGVYVPTIVRPHPRCGSWHRVNVLLMLVVLGLFTGSEVPGSVMITAILAAVLYGYHLHNGGAWNKLPEPPQLAEDEELIVDWRIARRAMYADALFTIALVLMLQCYDPRFVNLGPSKVVPYAVAGVAAVVWVVKCVLHEKASHVTSRHND